MINVPKVHAKNKPLLKLQTVIIENNILDLSPNPELTVNMVKSQRILLTVFIRSSVTPSGHSCIKWCLGPHQWPFKAVWNGNVWEEKRKRPLACPGWIFSMSFHHFRTEAPCPDLKRTPSLCFLFFPPLIAIFSILPLSFIYGCTNTRWDTSFIKSLD